MKIDAVIAMLLPGYNRYGNRCTWSDVDMLNISAFLQKRHELFNTQIGRSLLYLNKYNG